MSLLGGDRTRPRNALTSQNVVIALQKSMLPAARQICSRPYGLLACDRTTGSGISVAIFQPREVLSHTRTIRAAVGFGSVKL